MWYAFLVDFLIWLWVVGVLPVFLLIREYPTGDGWAETLLDLFFSLIWPLSIPASFIGEVLGNRSKDYEG